MTDSAGVFVDFDAAWEEAAQTAPRFRAFGREFVLPSSPPAKLLLTIVRDAERGDLDRDVDPARLLDLLGLLIGADTVKTLLDGGASMGQLEDVMRFAMDAYRKQMADDGGDAGPPAPGTDTGSSGPSSPTGTPSKPTSNASTDWLS